MIVDYVRGDILESQLPVIAFAVNCEGVNGAGFAGAVSRRCWPELADIGPVPLGSVLLHR